MMIGVAAAELSHKKAAATSTGFVGFFAYIGAAFAGYPLGKITQEWGWNVYFFQAICCFVSVLFLFPLWNVTKNTRMVDTSAKLAKSEANSKSETSYD